MEEINTEKRLKQFYAETDPIKRGKSLEKLLVSSNDEASCQDLKQLWDLRYIESKQGVADRFMGAWMELYYVSNNMGGILRTKNNQKLIQRSLNNLCLTGEKPFAEQMLYEEMKNLILCYITVSLKHRQRVIGFQIHAEHKVVVRRIRDNILRVATVLPHKYGLEKEFSVLTRAVQDILSECIENDEPTDI